MLKYPSLSIIEARLSIIQLPKTMNTESGNALAGRHAVVTGGGRGIGACVAERLSEQGARVTLMGRRLEPLSEKARTLADARAVQIDVCDPASVVTAFQQAHETAGAVDILVNNAGAALAAPLQRTTDRQWKDMLDVNLTGTFLCCREVVDGMRQQNWGRIINIASIAGLAGAPYITAYCAAKHGVVGLTRALALELARAAVTVNAICPGYTNTEMLEQSVLNIMEKTGMDRTAAEEQLLVKNPQHRFIEPEEVAATACWLCLPGSESVNGETITLNGGGFSA